MTEVGVFMLMVCVCVCVCVQRAQGASAHIAQHTFIRKNLNVLGKTPAERLESMMKFYLDSSV